MATRTGELEKRVAMRMIGGSRLPRQYVKFEVDGLLRADAATRAQVYSAALDPLTGWMTRDEVGRLEDLEPEPTPPTTQRLEQMRRQPQEVANGNHGK